MNREELAKEIYNISNIRGEFLLRSGVTATEYFDKYLFEANPRVLRSIAQHLSALLPQKFDQLAGLEMGGIPIATALSLATDNQVLFVRKEAKSYGTCKLAEGGDINGKEVVIVEDVVTSGGAIIDAVKALRERGALVNHVICVIDREGSGRSNLESLGLNFLPLFSKSELERAAKL
ncbi:MULTISPECIES: orotate phosphoribosyltransferase [Vibrio]|uniref:Orotate phosphoribosyltransferase n=2 Tax=Vibrio TaxID=662 RepID=A0A2J9VJA8_VIBMI|nr:MULTISPECIES: orotate phosphoribosyltransferase [Vibrio]HAS6190425.1 orotate phosphoribosyltransferase [Vibrio vulnificus]EGR3304509.1 orotate phosphoribosyltransferase [Vibrio parahaemolyticus]EGR3320777.1 orotate phosphoribosyltransferase [Vibrio parahaemolyticus]EJO3864605.1 orotate phosphoribosyltransferase [Vibrio parahaemolyticus]ELB2264876.1 orotate phosphoribosyltransferase [Vibrio parahaemolyticus]